MRIFGVVLSSLWTVYSGRRLVVQLLAVFFDLQHFVLPSLPLISFNSSGVGVFGFEVIDHCHAKTDNLPLNDIQMVCMKHTVSESFQTVLEKIFSLPLYSQVELPLSDEESWDCQD